ncbi:MAG: DUF898 domain-containing protein [Ruminococcaceae bacterium]|nr:DUF898 domain-containing protein [Oscillospiraceae bacterium]
MKNNKENGFQYTYSARDRAEVMKIREKYNSRGEDKMEQLRRLDRSVTSTATTVALIIGIVGAIVMGAGMSLVMTELGAFLGMEPKLSMIVGITVGVAGMIPTALAYPIYNAVLRRQREKVAPEIIRLTDELMK